MLTAEVVVCVWGGDIGYITTTQLNMSKRGEAKNTVLDHSPNTNHTNTHPQME